MPSFNINSTAVNAYTKKLATINRSALPVAIRQTLNAAALDVKMDTMIQESDKAFIKRKPTFFKAASSVALAKGFNVENMAAAVGFISRGGAKDAGHATQDLDQQDEGGNIAKRAFIGDNKARIGGVLAGSIRSNLRIGSIKPLIRDALKEPGIRTDAQKFIAAAVKQGKGGFVIGTVRSAKGARALLKINSIKRKDGRTVVNSTAVYSVKAGREAHIKATHFMELAAVDSYKKMAMVFVKNAQAQIAKAIKV